MTMHANRRWSRIENKCQLELFWDNTAQAAEALEELEQLKQGPSKENRSKVGEPRSGIKTKGTIADSMPQPAAEGKKGRPC